jgi:hypothetical protein
MFLEQPIFLIHSFQGPEQKFDQRVQSIKLCLERMYQS